MALRWSIRPNAYYDSVKLMRVSETLSQASGVARAAAVMGTSLNLELLHDEHLLPPEVEASSDDLVIAVLAEDEQAAEQALGSIDDLLAARAELNGTHEVAPPRTLEQAALRNFANLAVIAVPGQYAAAEAYAALRAGLHVFLFSDNVPIEEEVRLKRLAAERQLMMMGPDCGTAILGGVGLGFANRVRHGPVGIVGASGTGIQQLCCLLDLAGIGIAQAVGTGGRDLSAAVGGSMTRRALWALEVDDAVEIIAVISKPADADVTRRLHQELVGLHKPVVACLLGETPEDTDSVRYAPTLTDAARTIADLQGGNIDPWLRPTEHDHVPARSGRVYGLFTGGTLCSEAGRVLDGMDATHRLVDLGDDEYTRGRPHPIIDPRLRASMLADLIRHDDVAAILLDVILGDLAHPDPAGALLPAIAQLRTSRSDNIPVVAVLVGSRHDPQDLAAQRAMLERDGVLVFSSNAEAAEAAGSLVRERH